MPISLQEEEQQEYDHMVIQGVEWSRYHYWQKVKNYCGKDNNQPYRPAYDTSIDMHRHVDSQICPPKDFLAPFLEACLLEVPSFLLIQASKQAGRRIDGHWGWNPIIGFFETKKKYLGVLGWYYTINDILFVYEMHYYLRSFGTGIFQYKFGYITNKPIPFIGMLDGWYRRGICWMRMHWRTILIVIDDAHHGGQQMLKT